MNGMTVARGITGEKQIRQAVGAIIYGTQRLVNHGGSRRFFAPVRNMIGSAVESATGNPRAILRMVSGYC